MDATQTIALAVAVVVVLAVLTAVVSARRSDIRGVGSLSAETLRRDEARRPTKAPTTVLPEARTHDEHRVSRRPAPPEWQPPDDEQVGVDRRQFLNRATVSLMGAGIAAFGASSFIAFLWPTATGGFGERVALGRINDVMSGIEAGGGFLYSSEARTWITEYPPEAIGAASEVYDPILMPGIAAGLIASYQKCPHLGCRVPECLSSQWFECPCHGSRYSRVGEHRGGPAPRGLDHFPLEITSGGDVTVDTGNLVIGAPIGTNTTGQEAEGPSCIGDFDHH
jgi:cytochrome b6-f complex iron-sulfur subunit